MDKKKVEFSKKITVASFVFFIFCVLTSMTYLFMFGSDMTDTAICVTMLTISGGVFGMAVKHYLNAQRFINTAKVEYGSYENLMKVRLKYNEEMMKLKSLYQDEDYEDDSFIADATDGVVDRLNNSISNEHDLANEEDEIQTF